MNEQPEEATASTSPTTPNSPQATANAAGRRPIPMPSSALQFTMIDDDQVFDALPAEVARADLAIARDGSYVETSSNIAARALKQRYDQHIGVTVDRPSPFAITAFVNQHGKPMFRVGRRENVQPPALSAQQVEEKLAEETLKAKEPKRNPHKSFTGRRSRSSSKRHSGRLSVNALLSPIDFLKPNANVQSLASTSKLSVPSSSTAANNAIPAFGSGAASSTSNRKLRKTRSIPDLSPVTSTAAAGQAHSSAATASLHGHNHNNASFSSRGHSHSVNSMDMPSFLIPALESSSLLPMPSILPMPSLSAGNNNSSAVMHWPLANLSSASSSISSGSASTSASSSQSGADLTDSSMPPGKLSHVVRYADPFGLGIKFDHPTAVTRVYDDGGTFREEDEENDDEEDHDHPPAKGKGRHVNGARRKHSPEYKRRSPSPPSDGDVLLAAPTRYLREVQSFESGLTARQSYETPQRRGTPPLSICDNLDDPDRDPDRPPSAMRVRTRNSLASLIEVAEKAAHSLPASPSPIPTPHQPPTPPPKDPPPSAIIPSPPQPHFTAPTLQETTLQSRYTTEIFDVLQTYRGLPTLDNMLREDGATGVIRLSLGTEEQAGSAAPRDDPRFVIWGEVDNTTLGMGGAANGGAMSSSLAPTRMERSNSGASSSTSGAGSVSVASGRSSRSLVGRASSAHLRQAASPPHHSVGVTTSTATLANSSTSSIALEKPKRILLAATIERWIAQLTAEMSYEELLNFFITYRTYVSSVDLCHLLICRFHWSLQPSESDETIRGIVRVRTFVAIRFWLLTFFAVDFVPNAELRMLIARWLNTLVKDPILKRCGDGVITVKKLKKVVKDCKKTYLEEHAPSKTGQNQQPTPNPDGKKPPASTPPSSPPESATLPPSSPPSTLATSSPGSSTTQDKITLLFGEKFAEATRRFQSPPRSRREFEEEYDSDVDLTLEFEDESPEGVAASVAAASSTSEGSSAIPAPRKDSRRMTGIPSSSASILQHMPPTGASSTPGVASPPAMTMELGPFVQTPATLPMHSGSALSKVLVKTMGRLGRWKRVINSSAPGMRGGGIVPQGFHNHYPNPHHYQPRGVGNATGNGVGVSPVRGCADVSAFDLELNVERDLLTVNGGVESYLRMIEQSSPRPTPPQHQVNGNGQGLLTHSRSMARIGQAAAASGSTVVTKTTINSVSTTPLKESGREQVDSCPPSLPPKDGSEGVELEKKLPDVEAGEDDEGPPTPTDQNYAKHDEDEEGGSSPSMPPGLSGTSAAFDPSSVGPPPDYDASLADRKPSVGHGEILEEEDDFARRANSIDSRTSARTTSTDESFGQPISNGQLAATFHRRSPNGIGGGWGHSGPSNSPWGFDVVSIDELDLSDSEIGGSDDSDGMSPRVPPGLKQPKKLPLRRDFEFVQRRPESVPSFVGQGTEQYQESSASEASSSDAGGEDSDSASVVWGNQPIQQWQLNVILDNMSVDEDAGNVEDALRRLEGQMSPERVQGQAMKVDGWLRAVKERVDAGDFTDEEPRFPYDSDDEEDGDEEPEEEEEESDQGAKDSSGEPQGVDSPKDSRGSSSHTPVASQSFHEQGSSQSSNGVQSQSQPTPPGGASLANGNPVAVDVVQSDIVDNRAPKGQMRLDPQRLSISRFVDTTEEVRNHRSFILTTPLDQLAQHFAMIDRELFLGIKFEELISQDWLASDEINILDWAQFLKDRAQWKNAMMFPDRTSALAAVRARFTLIANFTASEIVLTPPAARVHLINRFIRLAFIHQLSNAIQNFNTAVAIVAGLRSEFVIRIIDSPASRKIGTSEAKMMKLLDRFTSQFHEYLYLRNAIQNISERKMADGSIPIELIPVLDKLSTRTKISIDRSACVPFIGVYLVQLKRFNQLPDLIDPTDPTRAVGIDPETSNFEGVANPEIFDTLAALPPSIHLEPLINVQKQRLIAGVVKSLVQGQHLATRVTFPINRKLFQKCLRLRGLDRATMERALSLYSRRR